MSAVLEFCRALFLKPQVSLMHQGGALQGMVGAFLPQIVVRDPPEFVIDERNHGAQGLLFAGVPVAQQLGDDFGLNLRQGAPEPPAEFVGSKLASRMTEVKPLKMHVFHRVAAAC